MSKHYDNQLCVNYYNIEEIIIIITQGCFSGIRISLLKLFCTPCGKFFRTPTAINYPDACIVINIYADVRVMKMRTHEKRL